MAKQVIEKCCGACSHAMSAPDIPKDQVYCILNPAIPLDAFIPPKPYDSWVLNEATCLHEAPVEYPEDGKSYGWDETTRAWVEVKNPE